MKHRLTAFGAALALCAGTAWAGDGLSAPDVQVVWPHWQARITVQTARVSPLSLSPLLGSDPAAARGLAGASVLGDYYFASRPFGHFRASGGLLLGAQGPGALSGSDKGLALGARSPAGATLLESGTAQPYLGLGFSGNPWRNGPAITADIGMAAEWASSAGRGRGIFGNQWLDGAVRDLRLSPVVQLGVRYSF